jgi:NTE family protein
MRLGLVLGAGGVVGMSYHAGVLRALREEGGLDPSTADLIVGTSAGSVVGALLRTGWSVEDLWQLALEEHAVVAELDEAERQRRKQSMLTPRVERPDAMARRLIGSTYIAARSVTRLPLPRIPGVVARAFPGGLFDGRETRERIGEVVPERWPASPLWLVAVDITSGRRVVLGRSESPTVPLSTAVLASCAIPAVFPPVKVGRQVLVDGGAHSTTHLDLAARDGCDLILGIVPMAFDPASAPSAMRQLVRRQATRDVAREARFARRRGATVLLVRPDAHELVVHGTDMLRPADTGAIARAAYERTARLLDTPRFRRILADAGDLAA